MEILTILFYNVIFWGGVGVALHLFLKFGWWLGARKINRSKKGGS